MAEPGAKPATNRHQQPTTQQPRKKKQNTHRPTKPTRTDGCNLPKPTKTDDSNQPRLARLPRDPAQSDRPRSAAPPPLRRRGVRERGRRLCRATGRGAGQATPHRDKGSDNPTRQKGTPRCHDNPTRQNGTPRCLDNPTRQIIQIAMALARPYDIQARRRQPFPPNTYQSSNPTA